MITLAALFFSACAAAGVPDTYDRDFQRAAMTHWPPAIKRDWCELKARMMVESSGRADAESPVGARGLLQVMPATAGDFGVAADDLYNAKINIHTAARVARRGWNFWSTPRLRGDQRDLERACYIAGCGNIFAAQKRCRMAALWREIRECLADVTGPRHAGDTIEYVERHHAWLRRLKR